MKLQEIEVASHRWEVQHILLPPPTYNNSTTAAVPSQQVNSKAIPVTGYEGSFLNNQLTDSGEVVSLMHWTRFTPQENFWYPFLLKDEYTPGP
jgi:hypothetical protein